MMSLIPRRKRERNELSRMSQPDSPTNWLRAEIDSVFDRFMRGMWPSSMLDAGLFGSSWPRCDLIERDDKFIVSLEVPGVSPEDIQIDLSGDLLTVRGEKKLEHEESGRDFRYSEREFGSFSRSLRLPASVNPDKVDAKYKNGVLTIELERQASANSRRVPVRTG